MPLNNLRLRRRLKIAVLAALPIVLYLILAERMSWKPQTLATNGLVGSVAFSPDGRQLAVGVLKSSIQESSEVQLWGVGSKSLRRAILIRSIVWATALSPDGTLVAGSSDDQRIHLWSTRNGELLHTFNGLGDLIFSSQDHQLTGLTIKWQTSPHTQNVWQVTTWNTQSAKLLRSTLVPLGRQAGALAYLPVSDSNIFGPVGPFYSGPVYSRPIWTLSRDGRWGAVPLQKIVWPGASTTINKGVLVFDTRNGKPKHTLQASSPDTIVRGLTFSRDGRIIAVAEGAYGVADMVRLWNAETGQLRLSFKEKATVHALAFSPENTLLAIAGYEDKTVRLRDIQTGQLRRELKGHNKSVTSLAFSPDGTTLATGSLDGTVKLWRIK